MIDRIVLVSNDTASPIIGRNGRHAGPKDYVYLVISFKQRTNIRLAKKVQKISKIYIRHLYQHYSMRVPVLAKTKE